MANIYDVDQNKLIEKAAEELKKLDDIQPPEWARFVKTGVHKERPPLDPDWWYMRSASVLRKIYKMGPIGVSKLRTYYGGKKDRGVQPEKFFKGSGNIIRKVLQQLENAGLAKQDERGRHKGRIVTAKGKSLLDKTATQIQKSQPKKAVENKEPKSEKSESKKEIKDKEEKKERSAEETKQNSKPQDSKNSAEKPKQE